MLHSFFFVFFSPKYKQYLFIGEAHLKNYPVFFEVCMTPPPPHTHTSHIEELLCCLSLCRQGCMLACTQVHRQLHAYTHTHTHMHVHMHVQDDFDGHYACFAGSPKDSYRCFRRVVILVTSAFGGKRFSQRWLRQRLGLVVAFSLLARIFWGKFLTIDFPPALFFESGDRLAHSNSTFFLMLELVHNGSAGYLWLSVSSQVSYGLVFPGRFLHYAWTA